MYCPRCGTQSEAGDRYCSSCGATLQGNRTGGQDSPREKLKGLIGTTPRARALTAATTLALLAAIGAFVALEPADDTIPRDAYTIAGDRSCIAAKRQIVAAERRALSRPGSEDTAAFARGLVPIVSTWRSEFEAMAPPEDRLEKARQMGAALRDVEIEIAALARIARLGDREATVAHSQRVDATTSRVEGAAASLGLETCARETIGFPRPAS